MNDSSNTLKHNLEQIQQKARERTVKTQNVEYDLDTLVKKVGRGLIQLDPEYQRRHRWDRETSSRLIESLILNIPIPVIFISQDIDVDEEVSEATSRYTVIDGQQRLTAIVEFIKNSYPLEGLVTLKELNGSFYKDLPPFLIRRLEERTIKCLRIDSTVDAQVKFDIFERLNTGSVKLEAQELRNATARGPFNELIKELAKRPSFRTLIQVDEKNPEENSKIKKMEDVELVLRFFALKGGRFRQLKKGFKDFLTDSLAEFNKLDENTRKSLSDEFETYIDYLLKFHGPFAFAKLRFEGDARKKMSSFNAAVYDAIMIGISESFSAHSIATSPDEISKLTLTLPELFRDEEFFSAVSGSVNDAAKVAKRIDKVVEFLKK